MARRRRSSPRLPAPPFAAALLAAALSAVTGAAHAQWFGASDPATLDLQAALLCIADPAKPECPHRVEAPPPAKPAAAKSVKKDAETATADPAAAERAEEAPAPHIVTLGEAIGRLQANAATPADMALIEKKAIAGDKAAVEVLAWSYAEGRGHPADPVRAFRLYGLAAEIGVANARRNQEAVFLSMSGDLRQQVLDEANRQAQRTR